MNGVGLTAKTLTLMPACPLVPPAPAFASSWCVTRLQRCVPEPAAGQAPTTTHPRTCQADEGETKKRRKAEDDGGIGDKAIKWAEEFDSLGEDDQYTYLEELAPRMRCLAHLCTNAGDGLASYPFPFVRLARRAHPPGGNLSLSLSPTLSLALALLAVTPPRSLHSTLSPTLVSDHRP